MPNQQQSRRHRISTASALYSPMFLGRDDHYVSTMRKVVYLGCCFALVFLSNVVQSFLTTLYPQNGVGFLSLACSQLFFGLGSFVAPGIGQLFGLRTTMILGSLTYVALMSVINFGDSYLLLVFSILNGFGAACLWIGQGIWLTRMTYETGDIGAFTGIFFTLFNFGGILGNVGVMLMQQFEVSLAAIIWSMTALSGAGTLLMCLSANTPDDLHEVRTLSQSRGSSLVKLALSPQMLLLTPYIFCQGLSLSFSAGNLPIYANDDEKLIVYILLAFGIGATLSSFLCGKVFDKFGMLPLLFIHGIAVILQYSSLITTVSTLGLPKWISMHNQLPEWAPIASLIWLGASFGLVDFLINTIINVSISTYYAKHIMPDAFSYYRLVSCVAFALSAVISTQVSDLVIVVANIVLCVVSIACYLRFLTTVSENVRTSIKSGGRFLTGPEAVFRNDVARLSVASIACVGPARPSMLGSADVVVRRMDDDDLLDEEEEDDLENAV